MVKSLPPQVVVLHSSIEAITVDLHSLDASLKRNDGRHDETDARVAVLEGRDGRLDDIAAHVASLKDKVEQHSTLIDANVASFNDVFARLAALEGKTGQHDDKLKSQDEAIADISARDAETDTAINDLVDHVNACSRVSEANDSELSRCLVSMKEDTQMLFDHSYKLGHYVGCINWNDTASAIYKPQPRFIRSVHVTSAHDEDVAAKAEHPLVAGLVELESIYDRKPCSEEPAANEVEHAGSTCDDHIVVNTKRSDTIVERLGRLESIVKAHELSCSEEHAAQYDGLAKGVKDLDGKLQSFDSHIGSACVDLEDLRKPFSVLELIVSAEGERLLIDNECLQARIGALATKLEQNSADSMKCICDHFGDASYRIGITEEECMSHLEGLAAKLSHRIDTLQKDGLTQTAHLLERITSLEDESETDRESLTSDSPNDATSLSGEANDEFLSTATAQPEAEVVEPQQDSTSGVTAATVETIPETVHVGGTVKPEPLRILDTDSINADGTAKNGEAVTVVDAVATLLCSSSNPEKHKFEDLVNLDVRVARYAATVKDTAWGVAFEDRSRRLEFDFLRDGQTVQVSYNLLPAEFWGKRNLVYRLSAAGKWEPERMERITMPEGTIYPADFDWFARRAERLCKELLMAAKFGDAHGHFQSGDYI